MAGIPSVMPRGKLVSLCRSERGVAMPIEIDAESDITPGDIYEDGSYHPCLCIKIEDGLLLGISLVDGSYPRATELRASCPRKLTVSEAWEWRTRGPADVSVPKENRWW
jgi:hypothetical protein